MSRLRFNKVSTPSTPAASKGELFYSSTVSPAQLAFIEEDGKPMRIGATYTQGASAGASAAFAAETYLAGSSINIGTPGAWKAGYKYRCVFDMVKTAAGVAAPTIIVRIGTLGTTGDLAVLTFTFGIGSGAIDTGVFTVDCEFRTVGSGTAAVLAGVAQCKHQLASTGLTTTGTSGYQAVPVASSGFDSTTSNIIGVSFNGGASFSGTNVMVDALLVG